MIFEVEYPSGERCFATGYPDSTLVVDVVPTGPDAAYLDEIECDFTGDHPRVRRVLGGPRRPTIRVRLEGSEAELERWMTARESQGWDTRLEEGVILVVATRDGMARSSLEVDGASLISVPGPGARVAWLLEHAQAFEELAGNAASDSWQRAVALTDLASWLAEPHDVLLEARELALLEPCDPEALLAVAAALDDADCARRAWDVARELDMSPVAYCAPVAARLPVDEARSLLEDVLGSLGSANDASALGRDLARQPDVAALLAAAWDLRDRLPLDQRIALMAELAPRLGADAVDAALDALTSGVPTGTPMHALAPHVTEAWADAFVPLWSAHGGMGRDTRAGFVRRLSELGRLEHARAVAAQITGAARLEAELAIAVFDPPSRLEAVDAVTDRMLGGLSAEALVDLAALSSPEQVEAMVAAHPAIGLVIDALDPAPQVARRWLEQALARADTHTRFAAARLAHRLDDETARDLLDDLISELARPYSGFCRGYVLVYFDDSRHDLRGLGALLKRVGRESLVRDVIDTIIGLDDDV